MGGKIGGSVGAGEADGRSVGAGDVDTDGSDVGHAETDGSGVGQDQGTADGDDEGAADGSDDGKGVILSAPEINRTLWCTAIARGKQPVSSANPLFDGSKPSMGRVRA